MLEEKVAKVKKAEAKARQIVQQARRWREELLAQLKKEKEEIFERAKEEAALEVEEYSKKVKARIAKEISSLEKGKEREEKELAELASKNFDRAVEEMLTLFLSTYGRCKSKKG